MSYLNTMLSPCVASEIFNLVKDSEEEINFNAPPPALILGSVCRSWRKTVWADPRMWDMIVLQFRKRKRLEVQEKLLEEWLSRTGTRRPLYLYLRFARKRSTWPLSSSFARLIGEKSSRLRVIECPAEIPELSTQLHFHVHDFSSLAKMKIYYSPILDLDFTSATSLRELEIVSSDKKILRVNSIRVNWAQLTHLVIEDRIGTNSAVEIVQNLVDIQCLSLFLVPSIYHDPSNLPPRELPHLLSLTLSTTSSGQIPDFWDKITCPALVHLSLQFDRQSKTQTIVNLNWLTIFDGLDQTFPILLHRSNFSLESCTVSFPSCWSLRATPVTKRIGTISGLLSDGQDPTRHTDSGRTTLEMRKPE